MCPITIKGLCLGVILCKKYVLYQFFVYFGMEGLPIIGIKYENKAEYNSEILQNWML